MDQPRGNTRSTRSLSPAPRQYDAGWAGERKATTQVNTAFTCAQVRPELTWASGVPGSDVHWPSARTENRLAGIILPIILCARCSMPGSDIGDCAARRKQRTTAQAGLPSFLCCLERSFLDAMVIFMEIMLTMMLAQQHCSLPTRAFCHALTCALCCQEHGGRLDPPPHGLLGL